MPRRFAIHAYLEAFAREYPDAMKQSGYPVRRLTEWAKAPDLGLDTDEAERFVPLERRPLTMRQSAWSSSRPGDLRWVGAARAYKGLVHLKTPFDLVLYGNLLWELQPRTIIELGSLQGGSALWFADQLDALGIDGAEVHSFELFDRAVHPDAKHPRLHFHHADLRDPDALDASLFARLPHPWLVVDDAHTNIGDVTRYFARQLAPGDYYVWEDLLLNLWTSHEAIGRAIAIAKECGLLVDVKYCDAFGVNVTSAANGWFKKTA